MLSNGQKFVVNGAPYRKATPYPWSEQVGQIIAIPPDGVRGEFIPGKYEIISVTPGVRITIAPVEIDGQLRLSVT